MHRFCFITDNFVVFGDFLSALPTYLLNGVLATVYWLGESGAALVSILCAGVIYCFDLWLLWAWLFRANSLYLIASYWLRGPQVAGLSPASSRPHLAMTPLTLTNSWCNLLCTGLSPASRHPCWAHKRFVSRWAATSALAKIENQSVDIA